MDLETARWRKSSYSNSTDTGACVEVAIAADTVGIRDTKNRAAGALRIPGPSWRIFQALIAT